MPPRKTRLAAKKTAAAVDAPRVLKPHPLAWKTALRLAKGDASRLLVTSSTEVVVLNRPRT